MDLNGDFPAMLMFDDTAVDDLTTFIGSKILRYSLSSGMWVCLKIGYIPNYSHLIGIMISKTIGWVHYFQTHPCLTRFFFLGQWIASASRPGPGNSST